MTTSAIPRAHISTVARTTGRIARDYRCPPPTHRPLRRDRLTPCRCYTVATRDNNTSHIYPSKTTVIDGRRLSVSIFWGYLYKNNYFLVSALYRAPRRFWNARTIFACKMNASSKPLTDRPITDGLLPTTVNFGAGL